MPMAVDITALWGAWQWTVAATPRADSPEHAQGDPLGGSALVVADRHAGAEAVAIAVAVVHAPHGRPVFLAPQAGQRIGGQLAAVGVGPFGLEQACRRVGGVLERVVVLRQLALFDQADFLADGDHGVA